MNRWRRALIGAVVALVVMAPLMAVYWNQQEAVRQRDAISAQQKGFATREQILLMRIQELNRDLLTGVQNLLDRPIITVKTIRRVVNRHGVRKIIVIRTFFRGNKVITRARTRIIYRTRIKYVVRYIVICRLPNGKPCRH